MKLFRSVTYGVLGAAALAASVVLLRANRPPSSSQRLEEGIPAGEEVPGAVSLERLRELGI